MQQPVELKLKQASAVLGVDPKDLQNLVQFKVLRPRRRDSFYWFDNRLLLAAKVAFYLKESLGSSTEVLARFTEALSNNLKEEESTRLRYVWLRSLPARGREPIEVRIPSETWQRNSRSSFLAQLCIVICRADESDPVGGASLRAI